MDGFKVVNSQPISAQRVINSSTERIEEWYTKASEEAKPDSVRPALLFNMDETMLDSTAKKIRVIVPRESLPIRLKSNESEGLHITLVFCVAADGAHLKPSLILPVKNFPITLAEFAANFNWSGQSAGWMTTKIFEDWVANLFIPHVNARRLEINCPNERALLFVDSHESRRSPKALRALKANNIDVFTFPSHTSHILQPLDRGVNRSFKMKISATKSIALHTTVDQRRYHLVKIAAKAAYEAMYPDTVKQAWAQAGISPWSLEAMQASPYVTPTLAPEVLQKGQKRKRSAISLNEKLITSEAVINALEQRAAVKEKPKGKRGRPKKKRAVEPSSDVSPQDSAEYLSETD
jgi:hypothetical protein